MFKFLNPNPKNNLTGDCVIRAISIVTNKSWDYTYLALALYGYEHKDMASSNNLWDDYLYDNGFNRYIIPNECRCYTVRDFCYDHPRGIYMLATGTHVIAVVDGDYYDTWDSGNEIPIYYFKKEE
jgi:hypothetical protein